MSFQKSISKEELMELPLSQYEGKVVIAASEETIRGALREISQFSVVGFDTEARPTFKKGQIRQISLIQIATDDKVYLLRIMQTGLMDCIVDFMENPNIVKVGIGLDDDFNLLNRLRRFDKRGFLDLNIRFKEIGAENIGARNLAGMMLGIRISKSAQTSNWEAEEYTDKQISYAATDAWICLEIYRALQDLGFE
ncbi:MAG: 3'-5' exonuclease [Cytophagales bacterium CG12_big_fil_rev_8_21_14_0_65_40_12]|nr:MAG: 3'-5' exonuclease [Cytophagales bacterium CG12_big_fil_rev_8_21_14_0_65_40_12]PIW06234.1 MAG: 3'-5' exonuclease domain-containing protein 2 [Cytophagales bacterium CG17_big_fil_post_rev_8_21_14_2_50_40_13]